MNTTADIPATPVLNLALCSPQQGRRIRLVRRSPEYAEFILNCIQNETFMTLYRLSENRQQTVEQLRKRLSEEETALPQQLRRIEWVIVRHDTDPPRPIGLAAIADYQASYQRGEFLIGIADSNEQKMGIGLEASLLVLDYAFNQLKLHKLISFVYGYNHASQANTLALGFTQEGFLREHLYESALGYISLYQNGLLVSEFRSNHRLSRLSRRLLTVDITCPPLRAEPLSQTERNDFKARLLAHAQNRQE